jgi:4'-phosphopantetheinyl transferase
VDSLADPANPGSDWQPPASPLSLAADEVNVWRLALEQPEDCLRALWQTLATDERARAERFFFERHRKHFIAGRGLLRAVLARYLGRDAGALHFHYGPYGKPTLEAGGDLHFNLSHSGNAALLGVTRGREIGVDLEQVRTRDSLVELAQRFFAPAEVAALATVPAAQKEQAFFNCWTRKEAFIKASGEGLSRPLDQFTVSLRPGEPARLLAVAGDPDEAARWTFQALLPWPGYAACLAVRGGVGTLRLWDGAGTDLLP